MEKSEQPTQTANMTKEISVEAQKKGEIPAPIAQSVPIKKGTPSLKKGFLDLGARIASRLILRSVILNVLNLLLVIVTIFIFTKLEPLSTKIQGERTLELTAPNSSDSRVLQAELAENAGKLDELQSLFANEDRILEFVREIDVLKKEGVITRFSFESNDVAQDTTKNFGLKIAIDFTGDLQRINAAISKVNSLHFLIRTENIEILVDKGVSEDNTETITYTYRLRGILYVDENLSKN